jgi:AcrR family transcriptional regulator
MIVILRQGDGMGIQERKNREKEERKAVILSKTKALILEHGIDALSMQDIADAAELSKATLYLYFQSKEVILGELLDEAATAFVEYVEARISPKDSGIAALRTLWNSYITLYGESQEVFVLTGIQNYIDPGFLLGLGKKDAESSTPAGGKLFFLIASLLERGIADRTLDQTLEPEKLTRTVIMVATSIIDTVARLPQPQRDSRIIMSVMKTTFELLLRGMAAKGTDSALLVLPETRTTQ